jgi:hypothetical protein
VQSTFILQIGLSSLFDEAVLLGGANGNLDVFVVELRNFRLQGKRPLQVTP